MIALEEKFLVNILYRPASEILNGVDINNINFEKLITLTSGHLMLPALFFNIQKKKAAYLFPEDFIDYIKGIYAINKARNEILLDEAKELSELLVEHNIKHFFLKGTALLLSNVFEDIGERMIGDIDFIIQHKDEQKVEKIFEKNNYFTTNIIDLYVVTQAYYSAYQNWIQDSTDTVPLPSKPTINELNQQYGQIQDFKMLRATDRYHFPNSYLFLFSRRSSGFY